MKKLIFALTLLACAQFANAQETSESFELKGKVRFVEEASFQYVVKFGEIEVGEYFGRKCKVFNEKGLIIKKYDINGERDSKDTARIISYTYLNNESGQIKEINEYEQYYSTSQKELKSKTKLKYDETGKLIQKIIYSGNGSFDEGYRYTYENDKREVEQIDSEGNPVESDNENVYVEPDYDENGQELTGELINKDVLDAQGNWIKRTEFRGKKQYKGYERRIIYF